MEWMSALRIPYPSNLRCDLESHAQYTVYVRLLFQALGGELRYS